MFFTLEFWGPHRRRDDGTFSRADKSFERITVFLSFFTKQYTLVLIIPS